MHSDTDTLAIDLARSWTPILMRTNDRSAIPETEQELHIRVIRTLITFAEEIFESDPTERYANSSFTSVTLMPNFTPSVPLEKVYTTLESSNASSGLFRSLWQSAPSSVPHLVSACTEMIESDEWKPQLYYTDAKESEAEKAMEVLMSRKSAQGPRCSHRQYILQPNLLFPFRLRTKAATGREKSRGLRFVRRGYRVEETHRWQTNSFDSAG